MLITDSHLESPDDFFEALVETHRDLDGPASQALDARLILLLANHIGSLDVLKQALQLARAGAMARSTAPGTFDPD